ncbi:hypothetical protein [Pseudarthrobacter sulfonivorans]|uniref:hypothetical protein n=1 Tax=Pseudarthrobacter sulfonivorans TaxID=121292 RepID=UPI0027896C05|nr:hypothetical protein [Pseudarthrobacter sulfonivorans]MDQ0000394.1 hypothetical protein [Pseudarthrobacter sulfonivorans]
MRPARRAATYMALTAVAALTLAGCAANVSSESPDSPVPEASAPASPSPSPAAGTPQPAVPGDSLVTYTFPDGRLSFQHPKDWRVELFEASASPFVGTATVYDPAGRMRVTVYTGEIADVVAGSGARTVLETDPVLGLRGHAVPTPHSSFFVDRSGGAAQYRMGLTAGLPVSPDGQVQNGLIMLGNRVLTADVLFDGPPFAGDDAAKDWYWGADGKTLKAILMSFTYR